MNICFITKYPPLSGGVSASAFWKTYLLANAGIRCFVISHAQLASTHFKYIWNQPLSIKNVSIEYLSSTNELKHIPRSKSYVTRLINAGCKILEESHIDLVEGIYLEPNGVVASTLSSWFDIPYGLQHAGSDIGSLFKGSEYRKTYLNILKKSHYVLSGYSHAKTLKDAGIDSKKIKIAPILYPVLEYFNPNGEIFNINEYAKKTSNIKTAELTGSHYYKNLSCKSIDTSLPTLGIYGKALPSKGHQQLISSLNRIKQLGYKFNLIMLTQGEDSYISDLSKLIHDNKLEENVFLLPYLPTWEIPSFIRACDAVCYLENNFHIPNHATVRIPLEVLSCGRHLILSQEAANKGVLKQLKDFKKTASIVQMEETDSLYMALKNVFDNLDHLKKDAIRYYENVFFNKKMETGTQAQVVAKYYEQLLRSIKAP